MRTTNLFDAVPMRVARGTQRKEWLDDDAARLPSFVSCHRRRALWPGVARLESIVSATSLPHGDPGTLPGWRRHASGTGTADGGALRPPGGSVRATGFGFERPVALDGYRWWYLDALSDDRRHGLTLIAFIGSVFSPYYASARRKGPTDPREFCALNVVLHDRQAQRWTMTERRRDEIEQTSTSLRIGPSRVEWNGDRLQFEIDETTVPWPSAVRGQVTFFPFWLSDHRVTLDRAGKHSWSPIATRGHVQVTLREPSIRWQGSAYLDSNAGDEPLENAFSSWHWSRSQLTDGTAVLYDVQRRSDHPLSLAVRFNHAGDLSEFDPPARCDLSPSRWRIARQTRSDDANSTHVLQTLLDAPFYARSVLRTRILGEATTSIHESLSLDRFRSPWVQSMLRFRIARPLRLRRP